MTEENKPKGMPIPVAEREILARRIAGILMIDPNTPATKIAEELKISRFQVKRIVDSDNFKQIIADQSDKDLQIIVTHGRKGIVKLVPKAIKALEMKLEEGNMDAIKTTLRAAGLDQTPETQADSSINLYLPSGVKINVGEEKPVIEVKENGEPYEQSN